MKIITTKINKEYYDENKEYYDKNKERILRQK